MCVSFVRRMENMLQYLGPDIRVHDLKKIIINYSLPFRDSMFLALLPTASDSNQLRSPCPLRPSAAYSPEAEGPVLFVGEQNICPGLMSQEFDFCTQFSGSVKTVLSCWWGSSGDCLGRLPSLRGLPWLHPLCSSSWDLGSKLSDLVDCVNPFLQNDTGQTGSKRTHRRSDAHMSSKMPWAPK